MVTNYYKYEFISPEHIFAIVKEELKSYFESGIVDDLMFSVYLDKCLRKMGRSSYPINEWILDLRNFTSPLPPDFIAVREAWMCTTHGKIVPQAFSFYNQITQTSTKLTPGDIYCQPCATCGSPDIVQLVYKTNKEVLLTFSHQYLLKPGNISVLEDCAMDCRNRHEHHHTDAFDIRDGKFVTNFREGKVHLIYYSKDIGEDGYQMVPDNFRIKEYVEAFIKYKVMEQIFNTPTDESNNQSERKMTLYKQFADEAFILADIEIKKETIYQKHHAILRQLRRNSKYNIN